MERAKLRRIWTHFGTDSQFEKIKEEVDEVIDAFLNGTDEHLAEEIADVTVMLMEMAAMRNITEEQVFKYVPYKTDRTIERIESGYYEVKK